MKYRLLLNKAQNADKSNFLWGSIGIANEKNYNRNFSYGFGIVITLDEKKKIGLSYNIMKYDYWTDLGGIFPYNVDGKNQNIKIEYYFK